MYVYCIFICKKKQKNPSVMSTVSKYCNIYCMLYIDGRYLSFKEYNKGKVLKTDETVQ